MTSNDSAAPPADSTFDRYRIEICMGDQVINKLGVPANRKALHVIEIARNELKHVSTATHAKVRGLNGDEIEIYAMDGWFRCQMKALKLR
ncbi:hypothetical protein CWE13_05080 [Aliidiomarina shirensis]|uniref:Uncharacterized protein n=2 Tax=Aliidiomarina shirensis TaxID=1048642 RepID=A0A432WUB5_9GAMM|nr:hypothetical protein CWE13_05080 [Aliidiomarina shirensis]